MKLRCNPIGTISDSTFGAMPRVGTFSYPYSATRKASAWAEISPLDYLTGFSTGSTVKSSSYRSEKAKFIPRPANVAAKLFRSHA